MSIRGSVSRLIAQLKLGHEPAASSLWDRYCRKLVRLARARLNGVSRRVADEEDVVLSAFESFLRRTKQGRYPFLCDRGELWKLLAKITAHKALNLIRSEKSQKRGAGRVISDPPATASPSFIYGVLGQLASSEPNPQLAVMMQDALSHMLACLGDEELRRIAMAKLRGRSNEEIAAEVQRSVPTIERRLRLIRQAWLQELSE